MTIARTSGRNCRQSANVASSGSSTPAGASAIYDATPRREPRMQEDSGISDGQPRERRQSTSRDTVEKHPDAPTHPRNLHATAPTLRSANRRTSLRRLPGQPSGPRRRRRPNPSKGPVERPSAPPLASPCDLRNGFFGLGNRLGSRLRPHVGPSGTPRHTVEPVHAVEQRRAPLVGESMGHRACGTLFRLLLRLARAVPPPPRRRSAPCNRTWAAGRCGSVRSRCGTESGGDCAGTTRSGGS